MKLGARILKTGIAIILSLFLAELFQLPSPVFAGIAAIFALQPTIYRSYLSVLEQIQGNIIGAVIAVLFVLLFGHEILIIGLAAIVVITINLKLKLDNTIGLSLVTMVAIMVTPGDTFTEFAILRFSTVILGIFSAFIVNLVFIPPKYEKKLYVKISNLTEEITKWIRLNIRHASEHHLLKNDIRTMQEGLTKIDTLFSLYKEERNYFKKKNHSKPRKLVIYRQMNAANKKALETLTKMHRFENDLAEMPEDFQHLIQQQLDIITHYHEHAVLKFIGKVRPEVVFEEGDITLSRKELFTLFLEQQHLISDDGQVELAHTMHIVSAMMDYNEQVDRLNCLISSFQKFHKEDSSLTLDEAVDEQ
ncbi:MULTISPECIES: FUSC family protein [Cytobacillus]|uniref:FUSC family protein n=1 Tax=Cytobacillus TaxID=2675230 RepID=UPI001CD47D02|nr:aromatic acid exporter family protein [Cytobacillus kochii]MCA1025138.1 aromatic acid exporter family protein [Cytobacillus kochii]MCM3324181.1 aromatic acid exporter family protein [Cytobacillus kochii]MCM3346416.1 aromatic acid exporter family protein [Cytobacillus kochii]MDM5206775.1 aromatic acid exporter family protein [Cytobacillus kochii]